MTATELRPDGTLREVADPPMRADLVQVVRCRDCKYFEQDYTDGVMFGETVCWTWDNGHDYPHFTDPNGFCYLGERRESE